jgi:hypothetical protein
MSYEYANKISDKCHDYDQATLTIHETTHVEGLFDPSTDDIAYGWPKILYVDLVVYETELTNAGNYLQRMPSEMLRLTHTMLMQ